MTDDEIEEIERIVDHVVSHTKPRNEITLPFWAARHIILGLLHGKELPIPDWLDEAIREAAQFNEVELDEAN